MGKLELEIRGNLNPKLRLVAPNFDFKFGGIEATVLLCKKCVLID